MLLVGAAFGIFAWFAHTHESSISNIMPIPEEELRAAAARRTVTVLGVEHLPSDAVDAVLTVIDAEAPPSWLGLGQNLLVSLGLVGTFFGLTYGIYSAADGIMSPDPKVVQGAMSLLMDGAKLAFAKSLAGVLAAVVWSFRYGQLEDVWAERQARVRKWLDEAYPTLSAERLQAITLTQMEAVAAQQADRDAALKAEVVVVGTTLNAILSQLYSVEEAVRAPGEDDVVATLGSLRNTVSQLADALPERMGSPIAGGISAALAASLNPRLDEVAKGIHALSEARGGLEQRVGDQVSGQVADLGGALSTLQGAVVTLKNQLVALPEQVQTEVRMGTDAASQTLSRALIDAGQDVASRLSGAAADLAAGSSVISGSVGDLRAALGESATVVQVLRGAGEATAASLVGVQAPLDAAASQVVAANLALRASTASATEAAAAIRLTASSIAEAEPALRAAWRSEREAAERLLDSTRAAQEPVAALAAQMEVLRAGCANLLTVLRESGADQTAATNAAGARLADSLATFQTGLAAITQSLDTQSGKLFQDAAARAAEAAGVVSVALTNGASGFEASMTRMVERSESLEALFTRLDELASGLAAQQTLLAAGLTSAAAPLERASASLSAAAPALEVARRGLESEREGLSGLSETLRGSAAAVQSILVDTQKVRAALDLDVPARLGEIERTRRASEDAWEKAGVERDKAWAESARRLTDHVGRLQQANADVAKAWATAEHARAAGIEQNAKEIAAYAERVDKAIRMPQRFTELDETLQELVAVLDEIKTVVQVQG